MVGGRAPVSLRLVSTAALATTAPADVIRTVDLTKIYPGDVTAVDGLNLTVRTGEIFGLLGPNGAGKTTTASMLTTRVIPTAGRAYRERDRRRPPPGHRQAVDRRRAADEHARPGADGVGEPLLPRPLLRARRGAASRAATDELLDTFRLTERAKAPVMALSGGMAQRLMVARAILHRPAILFLDEPTAGLDPQSRIGLWEILAGCTTSARPSS